MRWIFHSRTRFIAGMFLLLLGAACSGRAVVEQEQTARAWPMFGGTVHRNLANPNESGLPENWSIQEGKTKNVKWSAKLGSKALGGPIVAGGRVFVGTNHPHGSDDEEPKGVLMCFRETDGKFLWQAVHDALKDGSGAQTYGVVS